MRSIVSISALIVALVTGACGKADDSCKRLKDAVALASGVPADKVAPLVEKELTGPSGEALEGEQRQAACKMIVSDKDALEGYTVSIKSQLK
jgi:hypothetical protein